MLALRTDFDLALVSIEQLQLLLELLPKGLELCLLGLVKPEPVAQQLHLQESIPQVYLHMCSVFTEALG